MRHPRCIYRVPIPMRGARPDAYTPQTVLIGPHHSVKMPRASNDGAETSSNPRGFKKTEDQKKTYFNSFSRRVGVDSVKKMEETIEAEEGNIRASYEESTAWLISTAFVELILKDSIFIMEYMIRHQECRGSVGDLIADHPLYMKGDLILLENQLPYFIFEKLFSSSLKELCGYETLDRFILKFFSLDLSPNTKFMHFTDMFRCVYEESLYQTPKMEWSTGPAIAEMQNAYNLSRVGVEFKTLELLNSSKQYRIFHQYFRNHQPSDSSSLPISIIRKEVDDGYSLHVAFKKGCLVMSNFHADDASYRILKNVIAYEHCHSLTPYTTNYIHFLNFLITTKRDVDVLTGEGVLTNGMGRPSLVVQMVNDLKVGAVVATNSQYHGIAMDLRGHYKSRRKRCWATLNKVYFGDLWTGTATIAAALLLCFTLVGTVASVIQAYKSF